MKSVTINTVESIGQLHHKYPGQSQEQPIFIELDCKTGVLRADWDAEIGNAVPASVWHGHDQRFYISIMKPSSVNELMQEIKPLAEIVINGYESVWNDNNHVAKFTDEAEQAIDKIRDICNNSDFDVDVWDVENWLDGILTHKDNEYFLDSFGKITSETDDDELSEMAESIKADADSENTVVDGVLDYLEELRKHCIEDED